VNYAGLKRDVAPLKAYVDQLAAASPQNRPDWFPSRESRLAYWLNAYNALVTYGVVMRYPTRSVRDLGFALSFFRQREYLVGGKQMSLDDIEHGILRKEFRDPRIHFSIVCASVSCPRLQRDAFTAARVDAQLSQAAREFFAERRNLEVQGDRVVLTSLLKWYRGDFVGGGDDRALLDWIAIYLPEDRRKQLPARARVSYRDYDWSINEPGSRARAKDPAERELVR
jgi:hypothetical protein